MTYAKIRSFALAFPIAAVILAAIFSFPIVTHADRDIVDSSCLKNRLFGWVGAGACVLDTDPTSWPQYVCLSGYGDYIGARSDQADIANLSKPSVINCIKDVRERQRIEGRETIMPNAWGTYLLTPEESSGIQARLDSQQFRLNQERQGWEQDIDRTLANPSTPTQKAMDYLKTPEKYTVDKTSEVSSSDSVTQVFYKNSAGEIVSGTLPGSNASPRAVLMVNDDGTVVYAPQYKPQTPSLRLSELPDSAYVPLPKTTTRQVTECLEAYEDGEITYDEFNTCLPEPYKDGVPWPDPNIQTTIGDVMSLPAQKVEYDIPSSMDLDSAEDSSEWNNWTLSRNRAAERQNLESSVSTGLGSSLLNFFSRQRRESPAYTVSGADSNELQNTSRSFLSGWDPIGQIKSLLGIEEQVRYAEPRTGWDANPDEPGILFRHPEITDYSGELLSSPEDLNVPEVSPTPPAPRNEPAPEDTWYFTPGPNDQRVYFSEGDDYEEIYRNPLLTY